MATKKKSRKKSSKRKKVAKKPARKKSPAKKRPAKKKPAPQKRSRPRRPRGRAQAVDTVSFEGTGGRARSGGQSGSLQGVSDDQGADSESVDELLEEGNSFEAAAVKGVEDAGDDEEGEVVTHEVPEDDVPGEYLDEQ